MKKLGAIAAVVAALAVLAVAIDTSAVNESTSTDAQLRAVPLDLLATAELKGRAVVITVTLSKDQRTSGPVSAAVMLSSYGETEVGEDVELPTLGEATFAGGKAVVSIAYTEQVREAALANGGWLNLLVVVSDDQRIFQLDFPRRVATTIDGRLAFLDKHDRVPRAMPVAFPDVPVGEVSEP